MAKELKPEQNPEPAPDVSDIPDPPKSYRLYIALGFVALILFQTVILAAALRTWFPPPGRANIGLNPSDNPGQGFESTDMVPPNIVSKEDLEERPINEGKAFKVTQAVDDQVENFSLVMHVRVRPKEGKKFDTRYEKCKVTIKDRIESMLAASSTDDRKEVGSTAIKAKAKKIINEELGVPYVQEVLVSERAHTVQ